MRQYRLREQGFSLLEVIVVIAILSMFVMMAVPLAGRVQALQKVNETQRRLESIRTAMLGPRDSFDTEGRRALRGYLGDMGRLPELYRARWNPVFEVWEWSVAADEDEVVYYEVGLGQPRGLWQAVPAPGEDSGPRWQGPYLAYPLDEFPANADHLTWVELPQTATEYDINGEFEMRQTEGKLADAWGRSLLFYYLDGSGNHLRAAMPDATLYIVSEGVDMRSSHPAYDKDFEFNGDNLVLAITPEEWQDDTRMTEAQRLLVSLREALVGKRGITDRLGRPILGGYVGDHGLWPTLWVWQGKWEMATAVDGVLEGQPRGLWTQDVDGDGSVDLPNPPDPSTAGFVLLGFGWRGSYYEKPMGTGENEVLRDPWGTMLRFRLSHAGADPPPGQMLTITSAGPDGRFHAAEDPSLDDLSIDILRGWDVRQTVSVRGWVFNETEEDLWLRVRLHASPAVQPTVEMFVYGRTVEGAKWGNSWQFNLAVPRSSAGYRFLELVELNSSWNDLERVDYTGVFISPAGTVTAEEGAITLIIE
jgi:prepilin-type N-terminal cleavage/methylation domain-containing protein